MTPYSHREPSRSQPSSQFAIAPAARVKAATRDLRGFWLMFGFVLVMVAGMLATRPVFAQDISAREAVESYVTTLLGRLEEFRKLHQSDPDEYARRVEDALEEFVDFREAARGVMAKYSTGPRGATSEQLDRFANVFKKNMVEFYGSALASYGGEEYEFLDNRRGGQASDNSADIRMILVTQDGSRIELQYSMYRNDAGVWKMRNLYVEGVNMRRQYHSRFDSMMAQYNYDIDAVIDHWLD